LVYKKKEAHRCGKHDGNDDASARRSGLQTFVQVQTQALLDFALVYRKNETRMAHPKRGTYPAHTENMSLIRCPGHQNRPKQAPLWKTSCISTAANVQNNRFFVDRRFCPTSVQHRYNACPADPEARKPLTL